MFFSVPFYEETKNDNKTAFSEVFLVTSVGRRTDFGAVVGGCRVLVVFGHVIDKNFGQSFLVNVPFSKRGRPPWDGTMRFVRSSEWMTSRVISFHGDGERCGRTFEQIFAHVIPSAFVGATNEFGSELEFAFAVIVNLNVRESVGSGVGDDRVQCVAGCV